MDDEKTPIKGKKNIFFVCITIFLCFIFGVSFEVLFGNWLNPLENNNVEDASYDAGSFETAKYEFNEYTIIFKSTTDDHFFAEIYKDNELQSSLLNAKDIESHVISENTIYFINNGVGITYILDRSFSPVIDLKSLPNNENLNEFEALINLDGTIAIKGKLLYIFDIRGNRIRTINMDNVVSYTNNYYLIDSKGTFNLLNYNGNIQSVLNNEEDLKPYIEDINKNNANINYTGNNVDLSFKTKNNRCMTFELIDGSFRLKEEREC